MVVLPEPGRPEHGEELAAADLEVEPVDGDARRRSASSAPRAGRRPATARAPGRGVRRRRCRQRQATPPGSRSPRSRSSSAMTSGTSTRTTLPYSPQASSTSPRSRAALTAPDASSGAGSFDSRSRTSSSASIGPRPRTSPTCRPARRCRRAGRSGARRAPARARGTPATTPRRARPRRPRTRRGLPPNVPPSPPGATVSTISALPVTAGQRQPAAERLARDEQVGRGVVVLDRPDAAGAADAALHLVVHVEDPVLAADGEQLGREVVRHRDEPALALHRLEHGAGDRGRVELALEQQLEPRQRLVGRDAAVRVRRRRAVDLRRERPEAASGTRASPSWSSSAASGRGTSCRRRAPRGGRWRRARS